MKVPWICKFDQADNGADDEICNVCDRPRSVAELTDEVEKKNPQPKRGGRNSGSYQSQRVISLKEKNLLAK